MHFCHTQYHIDPQHYPYPQHYTQCHNIPIAPVLPIQFFPIENHPVASWNGISFDEMYMEMYMDDIEDDAFLTETDYQEMLLELDDDDIYSDEDLYNMYLIEKEELSLINQINSDRDTTVSYSDMFLTTGTGFDETNIVIHEHLDPSLKPNTNPLHHSIDNFIRPIIEFKDKLNSTTSQLSRPLKIFASSYKDMLVKQN